MQSEPEAQGTLFAVKTGVNSGGFPLSPLELAVSKTVQAILREKPADILAPALGELAMDLARNVTLGNRKGRAVANEAQQLASTLETMRGEVAESNTSGLPQGVIDFVEALSKRPVLDAAPAGHAQES